MGNTEESTSFDAYRRAALDLVGEGQDAGELKFKLISNSMAPFLQPGTTVIVARLASGADLQRGDIIMYRRSGTSEPELPVTHRLIGRSGEGWITKGDRRLFADAPVQAQEVLGKVIAYQRGDRRVNLMTSGWRLVNGLLGWFHFGLGSLMALAQRIRSGKKFLEVR